MGDLVAVVSAVLLAGHLLAMNVPSASPLICVWLHQRARRGDSAADSVGRKLARVSLWSLVVGTILGAALVAILYAAEDQQYWRAVRRFPAQAYGFALAELAFTGVCLGLYLIMWDRWRHRPWLHASLAVLATTNLLYHFPPLMVVLGNLASRPELVQVEVVTRPIFRSLLRRPELLAQVAHFIVASVAVAGVAMMLIADQARAAVESKGEASRLIMAGGRIALAASLIQLAAGVWLLVQLPGPARSAVLGADWVASSFFFLSVLVAFGVLHSLAGIAFGDTRGIAVHRAAGLMLIVVVLMTGTLSRARQIEALANGRMQRINQSNGTDP